MNVPNLGDSEKTTLIPMKRKKPNTGVEYVGGKGQEPNFRGPWKPNQKLPLYHKPWRTSPVAKTTFSISFSTPSPLTRATLELPHSKGLINANVSKNGFDVANGLGGIQKDYNLLQLWASSHKRKWKWGNSEVLQFGPQHNCTKPNGEMEMFILALRNRKPLPIIFSSLVQSTAV